MIRYAPILFRPLELHIPDGFLSAPVAISGWILAALLIAYALRRTRDHLGERQVPLLGVMAAFIFAAQAINFPVAGGTSGHLLGGALAAIVLGPWPAALVMTAVISLQALLFQDGGLLVMGWNITNMGILTAFTGVLVYRPVRRLIDGRTGLIAAGFLGGWLSVQAGAAATAVELAASGTAPLNVALPAMLIVHALIGIGEGLITAGALVLIQGARPDLLRAGGKAPGMASAGWVGVGLLASLALAILSLTSSSSPDGLERVAQDQGFSSAALEPLVRLLPDYRLPFVENESLAGVLAVILGVAILFVVGYSLGRLIRRPKDAR